MSNTNTIIAEIGKSFVGNEITIRKVLITLLAGGHVLLEDIPGVGKTTLAVAFSQALGLSSRRIQFNPDVMPTDIIGFTMLHPETHEMVYQPGAVICNFLLADEINRASTRSQSALLEAMEENAVTVDGVTHPLPQPFMVMATQNPTGSSGTQLLPDSQTDRFMMCISIGYPDEADEMEMLLRKHGKHSSEPVSEITNAEELLKMRRQVSCTHIENSIYHYILRLGRATREHPLIAQGASPRCTAALMALSQAAAFVDGRDYVIPEDVQEVYLDGTAHRLILKPQAKYDKISAKDILVDILRSVKAPRLRV